MTQADGESLETPVVYEYDGLGRMTQAEALAGSGVTSTFSSLAKRRDLTPQMGPAAV